MFEITMPKAGQSMEDGTVVRWLKAEGDAVQEGEVLLEVETDKATIEVEAAHSGTVRKLLCAEGTTVPVHTVIALVGAPGEPLPAAWAGQVPAPASVQAPAQGAERQAAPTAAAREPAVPPTTTTPAALATVAPAAPPHGVAPVLMPKPGQSVEEGEIVAWRVKPGDRIKPGDIIFDVETDKATIEVEAIDAGRLSRIVVAEGETCAVLQPVAYLSEDDAAVDKYLASIASAAPIAGAGGGAPQSVAAGARATAAKTQASQTPGSAVAAQAVAMLAGGRAKASPAARRIALERGIDLALVGAGHGPGGRILSGDVPMTPPALLVGGAVAAGAPVRRRMSGMRRAIAKNLLASKQNIPHFYMRLTIDAEPMMAFYRAEKAKYPCSVNDVVTAACARTIREFPAFRSRLEKDEIVEFPSAHIGIAVGLEGGLVVPVLVGADAMSLRQLAGEMRRIAEAARGGKVEGLGQGVFTITNLGMFGVEEFSAIINPPEAAILAVGAVREDVIVSGGAIRPARVMTMTLSADHRLIDGVLAAKFLARLKELLQSPVQLG
jgi:pyruvate dehydrogenase E2 component (dihydrolipoamide acetyltransferase)